VFPVNIDLADYDDCGDNLLACNLSFSSNWQGAGAPPCLDGIDVPLYITNECRDRDCPIGWQFTSQTLIFDPNSPTGSIFISLINSQDYAISVDLATTCSYLTLPETTIDMDALESVSVEVQYDLTGYTQCGITKCGDITASVSYLDDSESCTRKLDVYINYDCPAVPDDDYYTALYDSDNQSTVVINDDCSLITIVDSSIWGSMGHAITDFSDYRRIVITHLQSGSEYVMSSLYPGDGSDELVNPASSGDLVFAHAVTPGGVYEIRLCNIPTWGAQYQYNGNDDVVYRSGNLYAAIDDNQGVDPANSPNSAANWVQVTIDQVGDYTDKYCDTQIVISSCDIDQCFATKYKTAACDIDCNVLDLCKNSDFFDLVKLEFLLVALDEAISENDMESAITIYDKAKQICDC